MMKRFASLCALVLTLLLAGCNFTLAADVTPPPNYSPPAAPSTQPAPVSGPLYPLAPPNPQEGEPIYAEKCAPCHGDLGLGDGPRAAQLPNPVTEIGSADITRQASPASWFQVVTQGNLDRFMPPFPSLTDRQRWDVLAYVYRLSASDEQLALGAELYAANCASCHGPQGQGDGPQAAGLAKPPTDLTDLKFMASRSTANLFTVISQGMDPGMPAYADSLSEAERWALGDFVRSLAFSTGGQVTAAGEVTASPSQATLPVGAEAGPAPTISAQSAVTTTIGEILGQVVNESGGEAPAGLQITLHGFEQMQTVITRTVTTDEDGWYHFEDIELSPGRVFLTTTKFSGATYGSEIASVSPGDTSMDLPISVYETTTESAGLVVDRLHIFFELTNAETMRVIQLYIISNPGEKTVIPAEAGQPTLHYTLPAGATNLEFQDGALGDRYIQTEDGFGDTTPIRPGSGSYQVLFAFELPYKNKLELVQPMNLPANAVVILAPEAGIEVKGKNLQDAGVRDVEGTQYHMYNGSGLQLGQELALTVSGKSSGSSFLSLGNSQNMVIGLGAFGLALVLAGVLLYRRSQQNAVEETVESQEEPSKENAETIMDAILALDDLYRAGQLPEEAYRQRRAELKERLRELMNP